MKKKDHDYFVSNCHDYSIIVETREIFLSHETEYVEYVTYSNFIKNLRILERSKEPIIIHQLSYGGDCGFGMAIYDAIKYSPNQFIFLCHGAAASMGSIIPQAARGKGYVLTQPNCHWLIHEISFLELHGTLRKCVSNVDATKEIQDKILNIYAESCYDSEFFKNNNKSKIKEYIKRQIKNKEDWYFLGEQAVHYGFADAVFGSEAYETIEVIKSYL